MNCWERLESTGIEKVVKIKVHLTGRQIISKLEIRRKTRKKEIQFDLGSVVVDSGKI